jgi:hypothetical protein
VDEASEQIAAADSPDVGCPARSAWTDRRGQGKAPVGPPALVVLDVHPEHTLEVPTAQDEHPIQALGPDRADPTLGEGVGLRCPDGRGDDLRPVGTKDLVETRGVDYEGEEHPRDGLAYDPVADRWRTIPAAPIRGRTSHVAVWTGTEMIVWGGGDFRQSLDDGAAYDPATDTWRVLAPAPISPREEAIAVWTGREMVVTGGTHVSSSRGAVASYDPIADRWRMVADPPIDGRHWHSAVWTGEEVIVWGGYDDREPLGDGAA